MPNIKKVKLVFLLAIMLILVLMVCLSLQLISINKSKQKIKDQESEINSLKNQIEYYSNQNNETNADDKTNDIEFTIQGE